VNAPRQLTLLRVAAQFLTRLPTPAVAGFQPQWLGQSLRYFPLVGGVVGLLIVAVWWVAIQWFPASVAVGLMLAASLLITGAFHEDGFADACDGFGGGASAEQVLLIMKDSRIGAFGAIGIFMLLGLKWTVVVNLPRASLPLIIVSAHIVSRWCAIGLLWRLRYVRSGSEAKSQPFDGGLSGREWLLSGLLGAVLLAIVGALPAVGISRGEATSECLGLAAAVIVAAGCGLYFKARIGGYTGDCLGATQQLSELAFMLAALAVLLRPAMRLP
jgi:adenosylcobinamide-GDP ribazoletransferase